MILGSSIMLGKSKPVLQPIIITENGTYSPPDGVDGFSIVVVNIDRKIDTSEIQIPTSNDSQAQTSTIISGSIDTIWGDPIIISGNYEAPTLDAMEAVEDGIYYPEEGFDGFSEVTVNITGGTLHVNYTNSGHTLGSFDIFRTIGCEYDVEAPWLEVTNGNSLTLYLPSRKRITGTMVIGTADMDMPCTAKYRIDKTITENGYYVAPNAFCYGTITVNVDPFVDSISGVDENGNPITISVDENGYIVTTSG